MSLGLAVGVFFGERVSGIEILGNAVILLMQMTVIPYIVSSLVGGIGGLKLSTAKTILTYAGVTLLLLWLLILIIIALFSLTFPFAETASFFSANQLEVEKSIDYYALYIPSNPFFSLSQGNIPAIVIFSIAMGFALVGMKEEHKNPIITFMQAASVMFGKITQVLVRILPVGIFSMSASAAGTMSLQELENLEIYLCSYFVLCLFITFWVLPWIVGCFTQVRFGYLLEISKTTLITAFSTGNIFILIPVIAQACKKAVPAKKPDDEENNSLVDVLLPIAFTFPNIGKISAIFFIYFSAWFNGNTIELSDILSLSLSGLLSAFGTVYIAIPFLLDLMHLPKDLLQLFLVSSFITVRFVALAGAMGLFATTILVVTVYHRELKTTVAAITQLTIGIVVGTAVILFASQQWLAYIHSGPRPTSDVIANMDIANKVPTTVSREYVIPGKTPIQAIAGIDQIIARGVLRVGYVPSNVPFSYYNKKGNLVGFDIAMMTKLASDIGVRVDFIPFHHQHLTQGLNSGYFDIATTGLEMKIQLMNKIDYTDPVINLNSALVTRDHLINDFKSDERINALKQKNIAYVTYNDAVKQVIKKHPNLNFIAIDDYKDFFRQKGDKYDAVLISAQAGSAWTLFFPQYGMTLLKNKRQYPLAFAIAKHNRSLLSYCNNWLKLRKIDGSQDEIYNYWILGKDAAPHHTRWSILDNMLDWDKTQ